MEIRITTSQILKILLIISWVIFVGICIQACGFIFNTFYTLVINPIDARYFWPKIDLSSLYDYDRGYFLVETLLMTIVAILKAIIFYLIIKILHDKKLNVAQPFSNEVRRFILKISYLALAIGLFSWWGINYSEWFVKQGVKMPDARYLSIAGADVWLFMGVVLFVIAQLFKRGIEMQEENELTV
ncbi:MAG: DUF2975 domain-containing protein [Chitinophagaceae bacterium]